MTNRNRMIYGLALMALFAASTVASAQSGTATLGGVVVDESNAVVPDVAVTVFAKSTGYQRESATNHEGHFTFAALQPGRYAIRAQRAGFTPVEVPELTLNVNDQVTLMLRLKVEKIGESVNVIAEPPHTSTSPAVATVVDRHFVENLPMNGRSFQTLVELTPGVVLTKASTINLGQFSVNGQRADSNYFTVDGVSANLAMAANAGNDQPGGGAVP